MLAWIVMILFWIALSSDTLCNPFDNILSFFLWAAIVIVIGVQLYLLWIYRNDK